MENLAFPYVPKCFRYCVGLEGCSETCSDRRLEITLMMWGKRW